MSEYKVQYNTELDSYSLYHRYEETPPKDDWKTAALRGPALPAIGNAVAGAVGAAISNVATYPLSLIIARLQTQKRNGSGTRKPNSSKDENERKTDSQTDEAEVYANVLDAARKIYAEEGIGSFYTGLAQDTAKTVADSFLFFLAYEAFRQRRIRARFGATRRNKHLVLPILDELAIGVLAGAFAKLFTTPLANIVARKQTSRSSASTREIAAQIRAEKGVRGFWSGYSASLILTLNPSLTFFLNGFLKYALLPRERRSRPSPALTFLLAALSKSAASTVTYPFSMAKTRSQVTGSSEKADSNDGKEKEDDDGLSLTPSIISNVVSIARTEGVSALYAGLPGEVLKGFFSHGTTMLAKDAVYSAIVQSYYLLLIVLRRYPTPDELVERAREQAEEWAEAAREGARDLAEKARDEAGEALHQTVGNAAVDMTSSTTSPVAAHYETAEMVHDYVEDDSNDWRNMYNWFWEKDQHGEE
ncbi:mitochondrial carrier domain-containing protein [Aspergillus ambiguus]|uniref:putative mitochondrial carrier protein n=1 Tax=Aspergillus ambiguus TaxID=176160 RepID=UPI003CCDAD8C